MLEHTGLIYKIAEAYKNFAVGLTSIFTYIILLGSCTCVVEDFCCFNFTLKGWAANFWAKAALRRSDTDA